MDEKINEGSRTEETKIEESKIEEFLQYIERSNFSQNTKRAYKKDIEDFLRYSKKKIEDIKPQDIENFIKEILILGESESTAERKLASIKAFFRFAGKKGWIDMNPAELVPFRKRKRKIPPVLDEEEALKLIEIEKKRDRAIISLLYGCGLRISELSNLKVNDIDGDFLRIKGKGGKWRVVPIPYETQNDIKEYMLERQKLVKDKEEHIFLNKFGKKLSERYIREIVRRCGALKTGKRVWPHLLRHSYATTLMKNGADIRIIQELLGHSSINTTQKYIHADIQHIIQVYRKTHPREKEK